MALVKISELPALVTPADDDAIPILDVTAPATTKKIRFADLVAGLGAGTSEWTDAGTFLHPATTTDAVTIGSNQAPADANHLLRVDGIIDLRGTIQGIQAIGGARMDLAGQADVRILLDTDNNATGNVLEVWNNRSIGQTTGGVLDMKFLHDRTFNSGGSEGTKTLKHQFAWGIESPPVELPRGKTDGNKEPIIAYWKQPLQATGPIWGGIIVTEATNPIDSAYTTPGNHRTSFIGEGWIAYGHSMRTKGRAEMWLNSFDQAEGDNSAVLHFGRGKPAFDNDSGASTLGTTNWSIDSRYSYHGVGTHDGQSRLQFWEWPGNPDHENNGNNAFRPQFTMMPNTGWVGIRQAGDEFTGGGVSQPVAALHVKTDVGSDKGGVATFKEIVAVFENDSGNGNYTSYNFDQTRWPGAPINANAFHTGVAIVARLDQDPILYFSERTAHPTGNINSSAWAATARWDLRNDADLGGGDEFLLRRTTAGKAIYRANQSDQFYISAPNAAPSTTTDTGWVNFSLDESGNNLRVTAKYSDGTVKTALVALA